MGTHPIFESDFDCLTDIMYNGYRSVIGFKTKQLILYSVYRTLSRKDSAEMLGIPQDASKKEVKQAYLQMAKQFHPDNKITGDDVKFRKLNDAQKIMSVPHSVNSRANNRMDRQFSGSELEREILRRRRPHSFKNHEEYKEFKKRSRIKRQQDFREEIKKYIGTLNVINRRMKNSKLKWIIF